MDTLSQNQLSLHYTLTMDTQQIENDSDDDLCDPFAKDMECDNNMNENKDEDEEEDEDEDEDEDLIRKEMESEWEKQEKEKNQGIIKILDSIKAKQKSPQKNDKKHISNPKINPFVFDGHLKITFPSNINKTETKTLHFHPKNMLNKRKKMKFALKKRVSKKRKYEMKKYKKEFGNQDDDNEDDQEQEQEQEEEEEEETEEEEEDDIIITENMNESESSLSDDDELFAEEEAARKQLMEKPQKISSELRAILDIAADEEDENGEIISNKNNDNDNEDDKVGIIKNLLADKADIKLINKHKDIYNMKRNEIHQKLLNNEDEKQFELIKRAFIDGEYRKFQQKKNSSKLFNGNNINNAGENELKFKSRNSEIDYKNQPEYYLSDDEDKNEFCCYNENGQFYDIYTIRMKIMEWNKMNNNNYHQQYNQYHQQDDEQQDDDQLLRQKRVQKREIINNDYDNCYNNKINKNDKNAIRILDKLRNKKKIKKKKKTILQNKSNTTDTNFNNFYLKKGLEIPILQRSNGSSFLQHRDKCISINSTQNTQNNVISNNSKAVLFQKVVGSRKRKTIPNISNNDNLIKKRRIS